MAAHFLRTYCAPAASLFSIELELNSGYQSALAKLGPESASA
jgi:hypothetical protein